MRDTTIEKVGGPTGEAPDGPPFVDPCAFRDFIDGQYRELLQFLRTRTASAQDAEDAAQDSVARMLRYRDSVPSPEWPRLLYRIAINAVFDQFRRARTRHLVEGVDVDACADDTPGCRPDTTAARDEELALLRHAILSLPPRCRRVYLLKVVHDLSNAQIAEHCGISVKMVEKHLSTGLAKLRRRVGNSAVRTF